MLTLIERLDRLDRLEKAARLAVEALAKASLFDPGPQNATYVEDARRALQTALEEE